VSSILSIFCAFCDRHLLYAGRKNGGFRRTEYIMRETGQKEETDMGFFEEMREAATKAAAEKREREAAETAEMTAGVTREVESLYAFIDKKMRERAAGGYSFINIKLDNHDDDYNIVTIPTITKYGRLVIPGIDGLERQRTACRIVAEHYSGLGFSAEACSCEVKVAWGSEQEEEEKKQQEEALQARLDRIRSAKVVGTAVCAEESDGRKTSHVLYTFRVTNTDGTTELITEKAGDPFVKGLAGKPEA